MKYKILFVEDEPSLAMIVKDSMETEGFNVVHAEDGTQAIQYYQSEKPDLIVLDVMLPKTTGFEIAKTIRNIDQTTPIIFLTAKSQVKDVVQGFESGGNDYLRKPFSVEELIIRMKVLLSDRRLLAHIEETEEVIFQLGQFTFDSNRQLLSIKEEEIQLTAKESELLKLFCQNPNQLLSKSSILMKVWGDDSFFHSRSMDVFVSKLRKYLKQDPNLKIMNIRGSGYKLLVS
ncbi:MAG: response regulator transcription factor [Bacteroidota bacterium]